MEWSVQTSSRITVYTVSSHLTTQKCLDCKMQHVVSSLPPASVLFIVTALNLRVRTVIETMLIMLHHGAPVFLASQLQHADVHNLCKDQWKDKTCT